jgi:hypothetical protein
MKKWSWSIERLDGESWNVVRYGERLSYVDGFCDGARHPAPPVSAWRAVRSDGYVERAWTSPPHADCIVEESRPSWEKTLFHCAKAIERVAYDRARWSPDPKHWVGVLRELQHLEQEVAQLAGLEPSTSEGELRAGIEALIQRGGAGVEELRALLDKHSA